MGSASQLVYRGKDVGAHQRESLPEEVNRKVPITVEIYWRVYSGSTEVGQELSVGDDGQRHGTALYR